MSEVGRYYSQQFRERNLIGSRTNGELSLRPVAKPILPQDKKLTAVLEEISATTTVDARIDPEAIKKEINRLREEYAESTLVLSTAAHVIATSDAA